MCNELFMKKSNVSQMKVSMAYGIYTHYKFLEGEYCPSLLQPLLHNRMEAVCDHEADARHKILQYEDVKLNHT